MPMAWTTLLVTSQLVLVADKVPEFDTAPGCKAAAAVAIMPNRDVNACQRDEAKAKQSLQEQWKDFSSAERDRCTRLAQYGGAPSYVEVLTCLDMAKAAEQMSNDAKMKPQAKP